MEANKTPKTDALMAKWDDDGATRGAAFCELRDLARDLESDLAGANAHRQNLLTASTDWGRERDNLQSSSGLMAQSRDRWQAAAKAAQQQNADLLLALQQVTADRDWHKESLKRHTAKLESVWEGIREAVQKYTGKPCEGEPFDRLHEVLAAPTPTAANAVGQVDANALFNGFDITKLPPILISCVAKLWPGSSGLFWESALEKMPERIERLMARTATARAPVAPAQLVVGTGVSGDGVMVTVHLKRGDHTTVMYLRNHALNGDTIGVSDLPADLFGTDRAPAADAGELHFNATRLRNVARLVGLESAVPGDDATLDGARGSVLGMIAGKLHSRADTSAVDLDGEALRKAMEYGIQIHFEGQGEDHAVWADDVMIWTDGDVPKATRSAIEQVAANRARAAAKGAGDQNNG